MRLLLINLFLFISILSYTQPKGLSYFLVQAKDNSPLINKTKDANELVSINIKQIKSILTKPQINLEANLLFAPIISHDNGNNKFQFVSDGNVTNYTGYDLAFSNGGQYQAFASITQPLLNRNRYKAYSQKAEISTKININTINLTIHELEQVISYQYIICLRYKKQKEINNELINSLKEPVEIMQKLVENAIYQQTDLILLNIELKNYQILLKKYTSQYTNSLADLQILCGINDTSINDIKNIQLKIKNNTILNSEFLAKYTLDSLNILAEQNVFNQKYKPKLNLFANIGMNAIYQPSFNRLGALAGVNFKLNIFDGNQKKIQNDKTIIKIKTLEFEKQNFINRYNINKTKYLIQIESIKQRVDIINTQILQYKNLIKQYKIKLSQGQASIMDIKLLIRDLSSKKQELINLQTEKQILINNYNYWNF